MNERRRAERVEVEMLVTKDTGGECHLCQALDLSPSGIRLERTIAVDEAGDVVNIEIPLVAGGLTTLIAAREVWRNPTSAAYEFVSPSFAQQAILEKLFGNI